MHVMSSMNLPAVKNVRKVPYDLLEEWLYDMAKKNKERISSSTTLEFMWSSSVAELIFNVCRSFRLDSHVKYVALEIYERFVAYHSRELLGNINKQQETDRTLSWEAIQERVAGQSTLRILTSILLASKMDSHYNHLQPSQVSDFLSKAGNNYSCTGVFNSEIRVMRTLNHQLNVATPALYVETLLCVLYTNDPSTDDFLYVSSAKLLDLVYLNREKIYNQLFESITGISAEKSFENETFLKIKADYMLLGTAIIAATACIVMREEWDTILEQLHQITRILRKDIKNFSLVIVDVISVVLDSN